MLKPWTFDNKQLASELFFCLLKHPTCGFATAVRSINADVNAIGYFSPAINPCHPLRSFETPDQARSAFTGLVAGFTATDWTIIHHGPPNFG